MVKGMPLDPRSAAQSKVPLYVRIAETFTRHVATGVLRPGDRVPSLRKLSNEQGVSLSTALQAYLWLENRGYLEARPQSGFYIRTPYAKLIPEPQAEISHSQPVTMGTNALLEEVIRSASDPTYIPFGAGPHVCIGNTFAMMEMVLALATIVPRCRFTLPAGHPPVVPDALIAIRPRDGLTLRIERQSEDSLAGTRA